MELSLCICSYFVIFEVMAQFSFCNACLFTADFVVMCFGRMEMDRENKRTELGIPVYHLLSFMSSCV